MDKINQIITNIQLSIQIVLDSILTLLFQPLYFLIAIIQGICQVWTGTDDEDDEEVEPEPSEQYKEPAHIKGFQVNHNEVEEIQKIKKQLNNE